MIENKDSYILDISEVDSLKPINKKIDKKSD